MRAVKNINDTGRTIAVTVHQPSTLVFEVTLSSGVLVYVAAACKGLQLAENMHSEVAKTCKPACLQLAVSLCLTLSP